LANDIEDIWKEQPKLSFEDARDVSFKKFGVFGFMDVIEAKQKQISKRYRKIMWRFFSEWFTMPKLVTTTTIFLIAFLILKRTYSEYIFLGVLLLLVVIDLTKQTISRKKEKKKAKKQEKVFLLESMIGAARNGFSGLIFVNIFNTINAFKVSFNGMETHWQLLVALSFTVVIILFYVTGYLIPQKAEALLTETYPEYKLSKIL
jgi:hypothetical protein